MKRFLKFFGIVLVVAAITAGLILPRASSTYNSLVADKESVDVVWAQVETQYQRRFDLIGSLADTTRGYMAHEQAVFSDIASARAHYANETNPEKKAEAQQGIEGALSRLLVVMENYPDLKANETVKTLTDELAGTENRVNVARQRFNEAAKPYNIKVKSFPTNLFAKIFGFKPFTLFKADAEAQKAPKIDLEVKQ